MFFSGFAVGFSHGWQLALVTLALVPLIAACAAGVGILTVRLTNDSQASYGRAGAVAEEVVSSIRTVIAFGGELLEINRYQQNLSRALKAGIKQSYGSGLGFFFLFFSFF